MRFSDLSLRLRQTLFDEIKSLDLRELPPVERATFGGKPGWLISEMSIARQLLTSAVGTKSRPTESQRRLGGVGAMQGEAVRSAKRDLISALGVVSREQDLIEMHVSAAYLPNHIAADRLTEALSASTVTLLTGSAPGSVDGQLLRELVMATWAELECPTETVDASSRDGLRLFLNERIDGSSSLFLEMLRHRGWTDARIAAEIRGMLLAGWGSTSALVISALALGIPASSDQSSIDEVMRLYPPSFMIARSVIDPSPHLPFGRHDLLVISPWLIHRNPRGWDDPEEFKPARWQTLSGRQPWFIPFGVGARRCPAATFARSQARVAMGLAYVARSDAVKEVALVEGRSPALLSERP